jgi:hypothetical protein
MDEVLLANSWSFSGFFLMYWAISAGARLFAEAPPKEVVGKDRHDYYGQHVSLVHSVLAVLAAFAVYFWDGGVDYHAYTQPRHYLVMVVRTTQHSLAYFMYDMIYAECLQLHNMEMRLHHLCVCLGGVIMCFSALGGSLAMCEV